MTGLARGSRLAMVGALCALVAAPVARAQTPLFDGEAPNVWVYTRSGGHAEITAVQVAGGAPTLGVTKTQSGFNILTSTGSVQLAVPTTTNAILVQASSGRFPVSTLPSNLVPSTWITGLDAASNPADPFAPTVFAAPSGGSFQAAFVAVELAVRGPVDGTTHLRWSLDGGALQVVGPSATVLVSGGGSHTLTVAAEHQGQVGPAQALQYAVDATGAGQDDSDGDGLPDLVELAIGNDPRARDATLDRDGDGWSNAEELLCGSDPSSPGAPCADQDGDGWADFIEVWRGTDAVDAMSFPAARGRYGVELLGALAPRERASDVPLTARTYGVTLEDAHGFAVAFRDAQGLAAAAPALFGQGAELRFAVDDVVVAEARETLVDPVSGDVTLAPWAVSAVVPAQPGFGVGDVLAEVDVAGTTLASVGDWVAAVNEAMARHLVVRHDTRLDPDTTARVAEVDALVRWHAGAGLGDGAAFDRLTMAERAASGVATDRQAFGALLELLDQRAGRDDLPAFFASVDAIYLAADDAVTWARADGLQDAVGASLRDSDDEHVVRLLGFLGASGVMALTVGDLAALAAPAGDFDGDGRTNGGELAPTFLLATDPRVADSDGDGASDAVDPCPTDPLDLCWSLGAQEVDSDGDGVVDARDNCLTVANDDQADLDGDGVGDACEGYAAIVFPTTHVFTYSGEPVGFLARATGLGQAQGHGAIAVTWSFRRADGRGDDVLPTRVGLDPGAVVFAAAGDYRVTLTATRLVDGATTRDYRLVHALAPRARSPVPPRVDVAPTCAEGSAYPVFEVTVGDVPDGVRAEVRVALPSVTSSGADVTFAGATLVDDAGGRLEVTTAVAGVDAASDAWLDPSLVTQGGVTAVRAVWDEGHAPVRSVAWTVAARLASDAAIGSTVAPTAVASAGASSTFEATGTVGAAEVGACPLALSVVAWFDSNGDGARQGPGDGALDGWGVDIAVERGRAVASADNAAKRVELGGGAVARVAAWPGQHLVASATLPNGADLRPTWRATTPVELDVGFETAGLDLGASCACADQNQCNADLCVYPGVCQFCEGDTCTTTADDCHTAPVYVLLEDRATHALRGGARCNYDTTKTPSVDCPTSEDGALVIDPSLTCR